MGKVSKGKKGKVESKIVAILFLVASFKSVESSSFVICGILYVKEKYQMKKTIQPLYTSKAPYAYWKKLKDHETGNDVPGLGASRYYRFRERVILYSMEITYSPEQWEDGVILGGRPDLVTIIGYTGAEPKGKVLFEGKLPWKDGKCTVNFKAEPVLAVSQHCHWCHQNKNVHSFHEKTPAPWTVPYDAFNGTVWYGTVDNKPEPMPEPAAEQMLKKGKIAPKGKKGQKARDDEMFVHFESDMLKVSFSTVRPRMSFLGWDAESSGLAKKNLLVDNMPDRGPVWTSGPWAFDFAGPCPPYIWGGEVEVKGQKVSYKNLHCGPELSLDITFTIGTKGFLISIKQHCKKTHTFLEHSAWKFVWDDRVNGSISTFALPKRGNNRNGLVENCGGIHASGHGVLSFQTESGKNNTDIQTETYGFALPIGEAAVQLGCRHEPFGPVTMLKGNSSATIRFEVTNVVPDLKAGVVSKKVHRGLRKFWPSIFGFRPEGAGFSNNAVSINAVNCMYIVADMAAHTKLTEGLPHMLDLLEYTLGLSLQGGPGYACQWNHDHHHDTAPSLAITAGRIHQRRPDGKWFKEMWPLVKKPVEHILSKLDEEGRYICKARTGNRGSYTRSCVAWDAIGMGHHVGYASALAYRALKYGAAMSLTMNEDELARKCALAAEKLKLATVKDLCDPKTGWLAEWRSADGELHNHASLFTTAQAAAYGMLTDKEAREMLGNLEKERIKTGHNDFRYGVACQLWPIRKDENIGWLKIAGSYTDGFFKEVYRSRREDGADTFGLFINGCLTPTFSHYYIQATSRYGFKKTADQICDQLLESFDKHTFEGSHKGTEFWSWDGMPTGYEGTMTHNYGCLYGIAAHKGWIEPLNPEW